MNEETEFLQKIQASYAAQSADSARALNSLLFEYAPVLEHFPALKAETDRAVANVVNLDVGVLVDRFRPALDIASRLVVEIDMLDDDARANEVMAKFLATVFARLTMANAGVYAAKFSEMAAQPEAQPVAAPPKPETAPTPAPALTGDALTFAQANDLYYGDNGQTQDLVQAAVLFHRLAEKKHAGAMRRLALMYAFGEGVKKDHGKNASFIRAAADLGDPEAMAAVSGWFLGGNDQYGFAQSFEQAKFWATRAYEAGALDGAAALGDLYADENFPEHNPVVALGYYQQGSAAGDSEASHQLGLLYQAGKAIPKDVAKAIAAFELSVQQGKRQHGSNDWHMAIHSLVNLYEFGKDVPPDLQKALAWYHRASQSWKGSIAEGIAYSYTTGETKNTAKAIAWYAEGAAQQHVDCMRSLAEQYLAEGPLRNVDAAERWFIKAAEAAPDDAQYMKSLAEQYLAEGPLRNVDAAERWFIKAAEAKPDDYYMSWALVRLYAADGAKPDEQKWLHWQELAAALREDDYDYYLLGSQFFAKYGSKVDFPRALQYYQKGIAKSKGGFCAKELADIHTDIEGYVDLVKAEQLYRTAIAQGCDCHLYLAWLYRDQINDIDKAIAVFTLGADKGQVHCFHSLTECYLADWHQRKNPSEAKRWLSKWEAKPDLDQFDLYYLVPARLKYPEVRDVAKAQQYCDRLVVLPGANPEYIATTSTVLGIFLLEDDTHRDAARGVRYLEWATKQPTRWPYRHSAFELLIDAYDNGKYRVSQDASKAQAWREARDKALASSA